MGQYSESFFNKCNISSLRQSRIDREDLITYLNMSDRQINPSAN